MGQFFLPPSAASGQEFIQGVSVANYAALPAAAANTGLMALVLNNSGIWLINFQSKGIYISDGINWNYEGDYVVTSTADHIANTPSGTITATDIQATVNQLDTLKIAAASKDVSSGVPGLTLFKINFKNVANTFTSFFTNSNAAARTYTFPDSNGSVLLDASIDTATLDSAPADTAEFLYWSVVASALRKITVAGLKSIFALVGGSSAQVFQVGTATVAAHAVRLDQGDGRYAALPGSSTQNFTANALTLNASLVNNGAYTSTYHLDTSAVAVTLAASATLDISNFAGMLLINSHVTGGSSLVLCGAGSVPVVIGSLGTPDFSVVDWPASNGNRITNTHGSNNILGLQVFRTRPTR